MSEKHSGSSPRWSGMVVAALVAAFLSLGFGATAQAAPDTSQTARVQLAKKDYCGGSGISKWVPDRWFKADFSDSCARHDRCYSRASSTDRLVCDKNLLQDLRGACTQAYPSGLKGATCRGVARTYYEAVRKFAKGHYHGSGNPN
ncbi:phospholipase A2 [Amycolatopsis panacis]|nr:phospholipase A2 [Amycolatopsis panacis]